MVCNKSSSNREVYRNIISRQETRKILNKQPYLTPKTTRERTKKAQSQLKLKKKTIKIRVEIYEIEMKQTMAQIDETKSWIFEKINKIDKQTHQEKMGEDSNQ